MKKGKSINEKKNEIRKTFAGIHSQDIRDEERVKIWLEKKGFKIEDWHKLKRSNKPYDIIAQRRNKRWVIEVKGGKNPPIRLANFRKMLTMKNIDMVGLALVIDRHPYLLSFNRRTYSAEIAWITIKRRWASRLDILLIELQDKRPEFIETLIGQGGLKSGIFVRARYC